MQSLFSNLSPITIKNRLSFLRSLDVNQLEDIDLLYDIDNVMKKINDIKNINSQKTKLFHVLSTLKSSLLNPTESQKEIIKKYEEIVNEIVKKANIKSKSNTTAKMNSYEKLIDLQKKILDFEPKWIMKKTFEKYDFNKKIKTLNDYQNYLLMSLYINQPAIRNDYVNIKIVNKETDINQKINYLIINKKKMFIYLQEFKNVKSFGEVKLQISPYNKFVIRKYLLLLNSYINNPQTLFYHFSLQKTEPLKEESILKKINKLSLTYFNKPYTINDYRHIWVNYFQTSTYYNNLSYIEKEKIHNQMIHSIDTSMRYRTEF